MRGEVEVEAATLWEQKVEERSGRGVWSAILEPTAMKDECVRLGRTERSVCEETCHSHTHKHTHSVSSGPSCNSPWFRDYFSRRSDSAVA